MDKPNVTEPAAEEPTISSLIAEGGEGRRTFVRYAWFLAIAAIVLTIGAVLYPFLSPPSLEEQAAKILALPPGAKIAKVTLGKYDELGEVWLTLPEPKGPGSRLADIWKLNGYPMPLSSGPGFVTFRSIKASKAGALSYSYDAGPFRRTLWYDSTKRQYHFQSIVKP